MIRWTRVTTLIVLMISLVSWAGSASAAAPNTIFYSGLGTAGANTGREAGAYVMIQGKDWRVAYDTAELWTGTSRCNSNRAVPRKSTRRFTQLVGYSVGRLGPAYYLQQAEQRKQISPVRSIVLLDPGPAVDFECDKASGAGYTYATWLRQNAGNRLLIVAAAATAGDGYAGLRETYLSKLSPDVAGRVLVCTAPTIRHLRVDEAFRRLIGAPAATTCPPGSTPLAWGPPASAQPPAPASAEPAPAVTPNATQPASPTPTPAVPVATYAETAGGAANTWTNHTNAGGYQGPTIASNQTVRMACKVPGFRVADGNTWWYRIASDPWNGAYFVSADAFYNNGQTSGSLHGTPFVDPAVPDC